MSIALRQRTRGEASGEQGIARPNLSATVLDRLGNFGVHFLMAFWLIFLIIREPIAATTYRWQDDSYYYLLPAWNWVKTGHISTSGVGEVYGYQPLWFLVQAVLCKFCTSLPIALKLITAVQAALLIGSSGLISVVLARALNSKWTLPFGLATAALIPTFQMTLLSGKENTLGLFLLSAFLVVATNPGQSKYQRLWIGAGILSLLSITRTNYVFASVLVLAAMTIKVKPTRTQLLCTLIAFAVPMGAWLTFAKLRFDSPLPYSGRMKLIEARATVGDFFQTHGIKLPSALVGEAATASIANKTVMPSEPKTALYEYGHQFKPFASFRTGALLIAIFGIAALLIKERQLGIGKGFWQVTAVLAAFAIPNALFNIFAMSPVISYTTWYLMPEQLLVLFLTPAVIAQVMFKGYLGQFRPILLGVLALYGGVYKFKMLDWEVLSPRYTHPDYQCYKSQDEVISQFRKFVKPDDLVVCFNSGYFNYVLSDTKLENIDGLCASLPFYKSVGDSIVAEGPKTLSPKLMNYFHSIHAKYLIDFEKADWTAQQRPFENRLDLSHSKLLLTSAPFHDGQERVYLFEL